MAQQRYQRLTRERGPAEFSILAMTRSSLWLGDDHLLLVECTGYTENYKRFFFRDIQSFTIRQTKTRAVWNWIWGAFLVISGLIAWAAGNSYSSATTGFIVGGILLSIFGIPLLLNNLWSPTCACEIRTAVQTESLPSLCRLRKTQRIMNLVRPMIIAAQGQLTGDEVSARLRETVYAPAAETSSGDIPPVIS